MGDDATQLYVLTPGILACVHHWLLGEPVNNQVADANAKAAARPADRPALPARLFTLDRPGS